MSDARAPDRAQSRPQDADTSPGAPDILYRLADDQWLLRGGRWERCAPGTAVDGDAVLVLSGEPRVYVGMDRLEGRRAHTQARIERRLRQDGVVDGATHVTVEAMRSAGGHQALWSAVDLPTWQSHCAWAQAQPGHVRLVTLATLLAATGRDGAALVADGQRLHLWWRGGEGEFRHDAIRCDTDDEVAAEDAVRMLARRNAGWLAGQQDPVPVRMWCLHPAQGPEVARRWWSAWQDALGRAQDGAPAGDLRDLLARVPAGAGYVRPLDRAAAFSERNARPLALACVGMAVVLAAFGGWLHWRASAERAQQALLRGEIAATEQRIAQLGTVQLPDDVRGRLELMARHRSAVAHDPLRLMRDLRDSVSTGVRIQRVRWVPVEGGRAAGYRVDGMGGEPLHVAQFLRKMTELGWRATPLPPDEQNPGSFAYRLQPRDDER